jgi:hypothetical protein
MVEELQRRMGVRAFIFTGYRDRKGQLVKTWFVFFHRLRMRIHWGPAGTSPTQSMGRSSRLLTLIGKVGLLRFSVII